MDSMFPYSLLNMSVIWFYRFDLINSCKFMRGYLYFPNNLKDIKGHIYAYMIICKIFFQLMVTA